jgi:two-component system sensor histidine kinase PilS (NtrC family)
LAAVGRLSASIAHEIRNPLGAISHAAQLLGESEFLDKEDLRLTEIIQNHTIRMNRVIENVLHLSRRKNAEPQQIDLKDWLDQFAIEFSTGMQDQPEIDIAVDPADMAVDVDPGHLAQVLGNLCQNGLRYSSQHTGESKVKLALI